ncbi:MAG: hypothetical protein QNK35_14130 [Bacteroides sp.]|nr:hypothetical protein [Bacteroides sp.]
MKNMYSVLLIAVSLVFFTADMQAGGKGDGDRVGGIRLGYHSAQFSKDGNSYGDPMQSMFVGLFRDTKILPMLHFGTGLEYYKNGVSFDSDNHRDLYYVSLPLDLKLKLGPIFALGGFSPSFKVAERITTDGGTLKPTDAQKSEWFDIPLFVGAGLKIWFITLEARYHWGMLEVVDGYKSQSFQVGAGISF